MLVLIIFIVLTTVLIILLRSMYLIYQIQTSKHVLQSKKRQLNTVICIGSGGHTSEIIRITGTLNPAKYCPRVYMLADNDLSSEVKVHKTESLYAANNYFLRKIPRSRNVNQSYISSVWSTLYATIFVIKPLYQFRPDVILCNGPGTCIPICFVAFFLRVCFIIDCRIIFIESVCRVRTLSLTGKILQYIADIFVVQWPSLKDACFRAQYFGKLS